MPDPPRLYVATTNPGKLRDFAAGSRGRVLLEPLPGLLQSAAPAEDELTFEGNAAMKAIYYSRFAPGEIVLADDSGLVVHALGGAPGVRSARYAEDLGFASPAGSTQDERNNLCLLHALRGVVAGRRGGRYRCALAAARDGSVLWSAVGSVEGCILEAARGSGGFGYDPLFYVAAHGRTMAELAPDQRIALSHRGEALARLLAVMEQGDVADFAQATANRTDSRLDP